MRYFTNVEAVYFKASSFYKKHLLILFIIAHIIAKMDPSLLGVFFYMGNKLKAKPFLKKPGPLNARSLVLHQSL